ncbi:4-hydroxyphenylacetate 3-monooxygenase [Zhengella mangrovi]|uniref:4-hydroxyphenylacetate 3-monooxygenase n=2 Tax=Zhengella mangrovi TaxID=1982044 RepID=A0A2G1QHY0_9HYPH|nr:4-hydroxyphenylacetate 3-monooxygenase [Zhengella mangrovi]
MPRIDDCPAIYADIANASVLEKDSGAQAAGSGLQHAVSPFTYRDAMAHFAGHVHVVTTAGRAGRRGVTAIAACSVSDDPATVLVCLNRGSVANDLFRDNGAFAVNTLASGLQPVAEAFSGVTSLGPDERFDVGHWTTLSTGAPVLQDALVSFDCRLVDAIDHATHRVLFGRVVAVSMADRGEPLLYFNRRYRTL